MRRYEALHPAEYAKRLSRRRLAALLGGVGLVLALLTTATVGLILGPPPRAEAPSRAAPSRPGDRAPDHSDTSAEVELPRIATTDDAEVFARAVAEGVFAWDTQDGYLPRDYIAAIVESGDPESETLNGLAQDLANYLPTSEAWGELQRYETRQHLEIDRIWVPDRWRDVVDQAREGTILPGTLSYTVEGTRHRAGVWDEERTETAHPVTFTVFVVCEPTYAECRLLRLSGLDTPLV